MPQRAVLSQPGGRLATLETVNQPCFVCGAEESEVGFQPDVRRWGHAEPFILRRCRECGLVFNSPRLPPDELARLYRRDYYFFARRAGVELDRIGDAYLRTIAQLPVSRPARLLEVGSAKGYMLALLQRLGWSVAGVEIAAEAASYARHTFGIEVFTGTLEGFRQAGGGEFDVVLAQDVLEHVPDPKTFLGALRDSVRPGGWLVIDTPNVGGRNVAILGERWRGFNPFHVFLFNRTALAQAVENVGLRVHLMGSYNNVSPEESRSAGSESVSPPPGLWGALATTARAGLTGIRRGIDRTLLRRHVLRVERRVRNSPVAALDAGCQGDNLVCIASRRSG